MKRYLRWLFMLLMMKSSLSCFSASSSLSLLMLGLDFSRSSSSRMILVYSRVSTLKDCPMPEFSRKYPTRNMFSPTRPVYLSLSPASGSPSNVTAMLSNLVTDTMQNMMMMKHTQVKNAMMQPFVMGKRMSLANCRKSSLISHMAINLVSRYTRATITTVHSRKQMYWSRPNKAKVSILLRYDTLIVNKAYLVPSFRSGLFSAKSCAYRMSQLLMSIMLPIEISSSKLFGVSRLRLKLGKQSRGIRDLQYSASIQERYESLFTTYAYVLPSKFYFTKQYKMLSVFCHQGFFLVFLTLSSSRMHLTCISLAAQVSVLPQSQVSSLWQILPTSPRSQSPLSHGCTRSLRKMRLLVLNQQLLKQGRQVKSSCSRPISFQNVQRKGSQSWWVLVRLKLLSSRQTWLNFWLSRLNGSMQFCMLYFVAKMLVCRLRNTLLLSTMISSSQFRFCQLWLLWLTILSDTPITWPSLLTMSILFIPSCEESINSSIVLFSSTLCYPVTVMIIRSCRCSSSSLLRLKMYVVVQPEAISMSDCELSVHEARACKQKITSRRENKAHGRILALNIIYSGIIIVIALGCELTDWHMPKRGFESSQQIGVGVNQNSVLQILQPQKQ